MIGYSEIRDLSAQYGVPPETIEKDYCISWILYALSSVRLADKLVFYGGTAIQKIHFQHRFSEDMDFISRQNILFKEEAKPALESMFARLREDCGLNLAVADDVLERDHIQVFLQYDGFSELTHKKRLKIDIVHGQPYSCVPRRFPVLNLYSDLAGRRHEVAAYTLEGIAAEKIDCIFGGRRIEPRDVYDLWGILKSGKIQMEEIKKGYNAKYSSGFDYVVKQLPALLAGKGYKDIWKLRLGNQVPDLPEYQVVESELRRLLQ